MPHRPKRRNQEKSANIRMPQAHPFGSEPPVDNFPPAGVDGFVTSDTTLPLNVFGTDPVASYDGRNLRLFDVDAVEIHLVKHGKWHYHAGREEYRGIVRMLLGIIWGMTVLLVGIVVYGWSPRH